MNRLAKLQNRRAAIVASLQAINDAAAKEDRLELNEAEQAEYSALEGELKQVAMAIAREESLREQEKLLARVPDPNADTEREASDRRGNVRVLGPGWRDDPRRGFRSSKEFFRGVMDATIAGTTEDERLLSLSARRAGFKATAGSDEAGTHSDPFGGFLVPTGFVPNLLSLPAEGDPTAGRTTMVPMEAPSIEIPARTDKDHTTSVSGGLVVYRRAETQAVTASKMTTEQVKLTATPLMGLSYATEELIADSAISFAALLAAGFQAEFSSKILDEKINGTGVGCMEGVINSPCVVSISKETGQAADSILYQNIIKMRARCWRYQDAIWLYNQDCLPQLMQLVMPIGTSGVPMWATSARDGEPDMLLGRPAFPTEYCPTLGDTGDILLGNWSQYLEGVHQAMESAESLHVRFEYNERTFRFLMRNDGRCWWRSVLTPKKSAATLSPFVKINARA